MPSPPSKEEIQSLKIAISLERFESYRKSTGDTDHEILDRYAWNMALSEELYATLHTLEIGFRNSISIAIGTVKKEPEWLLHVPDWIGDDFQARVQEAIQDLRAESELTHARMVQEMSFGFWTSFLNSKHETLFHQIGALTFPHMPRAIRHRKTASSRFERIRRLRNRVFHYRRIWNRHDLRAEYEELLTVIDWINPSLRLVIGDVSRFSRCVEAGPAGFRSL